MVLKLLLIQFVYCWVGGLWSSIFKCTTLFISKTFAYKPIDKNNIIITVIGIPVVENTLKFVDDQKLGGNDLSFINILLILKMDTCFISGISFAKACNLSSVRLDMFRDYIRLKLLILEYDLLKSNLFLGLP